MNVLLRLGRGLGIVAFVGAISFGAKQCSAKLWNGTDFTAFEQVQMEELKRLGVYEEFESRVKNAASYSDAVKEGALIVNLGLLRADDNVVRERASGLRNIASAGDADACTLLWLGSRSGMSQDVMRSAFDGLSEPDMKTLARASAGAIKAALEGHSFKPRVQEEDLDRVWELIGNEIPDDDIDRFAGNLEFPLQVPRVEMCWMVYTLYNSALKLSPAQGAAFLRMLSYYELQDVTSSQYPN